MLRGKVLQEHIIGVHFTTKDVLKSKLMHKSFNNFETIFKEISPKTGLFVNQETNEIQFETKRKSWSQTELVEKLENELNGKDITEALKNKEWSVLFELMIQQRWDDANGSADVALDLLKALCKIVCPNLKVAYSALFQACDADKNNFSVIKILKAHVVEMFKDIPSDQKDDKNTTLLRPFEQHRKLRQKKKTVHNETFKDPEPAAARAACSKVHPEVKKVASPDVQEDFDKNITLHEAVRENRLSVVELLLEQGAEVDSTDDKFQTPLMLACRLPQSECVTDCVTMLLKHTTRLKDVSSPFCGTDDRELHGVIFDEAISKYRARRWNEKEKEYVYSGSYAGKDKAARESDTLARKLMENGKILKMLTRGNTLEHFNDKKLQANLKISSFLTRLFLFFRTVLILDFFQLFPLFLRLTFFWLYYSTWNLPSAPVSYHADMKDADGKTALHHAADNGNFSIIETLLEYGANIDAIDDLNQSPLLIASKRHNCRALLALYQRANPDLKDNAGKTAQDYVHVRETNCKLCNACLNYAVGNMRFYKFFWNFFPWLWFISALALFVPFAFEDNSYPPATTSGQHS